MSNEWKKIGGDSPEEEGEKTPTWDFEAKDELVGIYKGVKTGVGEHKSNVYSFEVDGVVYSVWGGIVLDDRLKELTGEETVKIVYKGKPSGKRYKNYDVYVR